MGIRRTIKRFVALLLAVPSYPPNDAVLTPADYCSNIVEQNREGATDTNIRFSDLTEMRPLRLRPDSSALPG